MELQGKVLKLHNISQGIGFTIKHYLSKHLKEKRKYRSPRTSQHLTERCARTRVQPDLLWGLEEEPLHSMDLPFFRSIVAKHFSQWGNTDCQCQSGFGVSTIHRIKYLSQNISHPEPGDFRGLQEIEVSPAKGKISSSEETKIGENPSAKKIGVLWYQNLSIRQHKFSLMSTLRPICSLYPRFVVKITILYKW